MSPGGPAIYLASGNLNKLEEFREMIESSGRSIDLRGADGVGGMPEVEESGLTFEENALIKAQALALLADEKAWVLADDSGLVVDALDGGPGVLSARFAGPGAAASDNNRKLLHTLRGIEPDRRTARFVCVLCLLRKGSPARYFTGKCEGHIMSTPSGNEGFGYDPLFRPVGFTETFASMGAAAKHQLSHRGKAVAELVRFLDSQAFTGT